MAPLSINDPDLRSAIGTALASAGEVLVLVRFAMGAGRRDWFLVHSEQELDDMLERVRVSFPSSFSHAVEVHADVFPLRGGDVERLRARALELIEPREGVLACRLDGDLELQHVREYDQATDVIEWFDEPLEGERMVGIDPMTRDAFYPDVTDAFLAYLPAEDGTIRLGAY